jgi:hypothetical protein
VSQLPRNAETLLNMRKNRVKPELPVLVSLIGPLDFNNVTLTADANSDYDWTLIAGLDVDLMTAQSVPFGRVLATLSALADAVPRQMVLSFREGAQVDCGQWRIAGEQTYFDWFPMAVSPRRAKPVNHVKAYLQGQKVEKALWDEMGKRLPIPWDLEMDAIVKKITEERQCA